MTFNARVVLGCRVRTACLRCYSCCRTAHTHVLNTWQCLHCTDELCAGGLLLICWSRRTAQPACPCMQVVLRKLTQMCTWSARAAYTSCTHSRAFEQLPCFQTACVPMSCAVLDGNSFLMGLCRLLLDGSPAPTQVRRPTAVSCPFRLAFRSACVCALMRL